MSRFLTGTTLPSKLLSLDLLNRSGSKAERYERILAHRIDCQRAISPPVQQKGNTTTKGVYVEALRMSTAETGISTTVGIPKPKLQALMQSAVGMNAGRAVIGIGRRKVYSFVAQSVVPLQRRHESATEKVEVSSGGGGWGRAKKAAPVAPPALPQPEKITVSASVRCAFQIL